MDGYVAAPLPEKQSNYVVMRSILLGVLAFLLVCVIWTSYNKEGFTSGNAPKDTLEKIKGSNTELNDTLNISTYRTSYEDIIGELELWADNSMLNLLAQGKIGLDSSDKCADSISQFNDLFTFKTNLTNLMTSLDKNG
jgi:hypothetical protein